MSGYTETEKIKILYEESLGEIHDVVERIEKVATVMTRVADSQREKASNVGTVLPLDEGPESLWPGSIMAGSLAAFAITMIALGAYVGGGRENWGIAGIVGTSAALGMLVGTVIGYYTNGKIVQARARRAFWNEPNRKAWREELRRKLQER